MAITTNKIRIFCDIDGTMAEWREAEDFSALLRKGYFRSLRPNQNVVAALQILQEEHGDKVELFSLSAYLTESTTAVAEKEEWLCEHASFIPAENRLFCPCGSDKRAVAPGGIRPTDVLLDDYSVNLLKWTPSGRGLKLLNGINGTKGKWTGAAVSMFTHPKELAKEILSFARSIA